MSVYRDKKRGTFVFEFDKRINGERVRAVKHLPKTWNQAQADAYDRQESARLYAIATRVQRAEFSIEDAIDCYLKERVPKLKTGDNVTKELALLFPYYQGRPIESLPDVCKAYRLKATKTDGETPLSPASIRNRIRLLTAACRYAWKNHHMGESDPAAKVTVPEVRNERHEYASRSEMLTIAKLCQNKGARMAIRMAFYSGMRLGEILRAEVSGTAWVLRDTKNGNPRIVPIHPKVAVCARKFKKMPRITVQDNWSRARDLAGLGHFHFHDLRHSSASEMINAGVDLYTVGAVLGHKDARSTQRYSHLNTDALSVAVGKIGQKIPNMAQRKSA
jgi:integrase